MIIPIFYFRGKAQLAPTFCVGKVGEYTILPVLNNPDGKYVNTGICPFENAQGTWELKCTFKTDYSGASAYGCKGNDETTQHRFFIADDTPTDANFNVAIKSNHTSKVGNFGLPNIFTLNPTNDAYGMNGVIIGYDSVGFTKNVNPFILFQRGPSAGRDLPFYYLKIYDPTDKFLLNHFVPAMRNSDSVQGALDLITGNFCPLQ